MLLYADEHGIHNQDDRDEFVELIYALDDEWLAQMRKQLSPQKPQQHGNPQSSNRRIRR